MSKATVRISYGNRSGLTPMATLRLLHEERQVTERDIRAQDMNEARDWLRKGLEARRKEALEQLEQLDYNLANLDTLYADITPLLDELTLNYGEVVEALKALKAKPGKAKVGRLTMDNDRMSPPGYDVLVFQLPDHEPVCEMFSEDVMALIRKASVEAGFVNRQEWNGLGFATWSIQLEPYREAVATAA